MADNYLVRNSKRIECDNCGRTHDFLSRVSEHARCGTPVAFSEEVAKTHADLFANGEDDMEIVPDNTLVVLDGSARKLPQAHGSTVRLDQDRSGLMTRM